MSDREFEITIPVLNEEERLEEGVTRTIEYLSSGVIPRYKIVIADNGSTDRTEGVAKTLIRRYPQVRFIKVGKRGVGLALKTSWDGSKADIIGYMDVDLATDLKHLEQVWRLMGQAGTEIVNGSRLLPESQVLGRSVSREIISRVFNSILRLMLGVKFSDGMCGFKFIKKTAYDKLRAFGLGHDDWFFCTELLVKAEWLGLTIKDLPVTWRDDGDSRVALARTVRQYLKGIIQLERLKSKAARKING